ncbi:hypothetical protein GQ600_5127 [Phytophthora cactorum]|nr:hypothetical protein GQ600_5127 [Phytophthora cactorum]
MVKSRPPLAKSRSYYELRVVAPSCSAYNARPASAASAVEWRRAGCARSRSPALGLRYVLTRAPERASHCWTRSCSSLPR